MSAKKRIVIPSTEEMARYGDTGSPEQAAPTGAPAEAVGTASDERASAPEDAAGQVGAAPSPAAQGGAVASAEEAAPTVQGQVRSEADEWKDKFLRAKADLANYQRRSEREHEEAIRYANAAMVKKLLPILDDLERLLAAATSQNHAEVDTVVNAVRLTLENFQKVLEECQVQRIEAQGQIFDPEIHEAIMEQPSAEHPHRTVLQEVGKGYRLHERVLRPAKVIVSKQVAQPGAEAGEAG